MRTKELLERIESLEQRVKLLEDRNRQQAVTCEMGPVTLSPEDADAFAARVERVVLDALARGRMPSQGDSNGT